MKTFEQWKVDHVRKDLAKHVAKRTVSEALDIEIIDFARPDSALYCIRYVFDKSRNVLTISGDLGFAVLWCAWGRNGLTPESFAKSFSEKNLHYFNEKIMASDSQFEYDRDVFNEDLEEAVKDWKKRKVLDDDEIEDLKDGLVDSFYGSDGLQEANLNTVTLDLLRRAYTDWYYWIHDAGKVYDIRLYHWVIGMRMAMEQLEKQG